MFNQCLICGLTFSSATSASLNLSGGYWNTSRDQITWTASPSGMNFTTASGSTCVFNPSECTPGEYTVKAQSKLSGAYDTCIVRIFKATFITPARDPIVWPNDSGDGQNQFTYSSANPGVLTMNLKVEVEPSGMASEIADSCLFAVENVGSITPSWDSASPGGKPTPSGDYLLATVTFTGLLEHNDDFGWKTATLMYNSLMEAETQYGVFFNKTAINHPTCTTCGSCPNWFYYWCQTVANGANTTMIYTDTSVSGRSEYDYLNGRKILIMNDAAGIQTVAVWDFPTGIDLFAWITRHEAKHHTQLTYFWPVSWDANLDSDWDWLPNNRERGPNAYMLGRDYDPDNPATFLDTIGYNGNPNTTTVYINDVEDICMRQQTQTSGEYPLDVLWTNGDANSHDWANPGKQSKSKQ